MTTYAMKAHLVGMPRHRPHDYKLIEAYHQETGSTDPTYWQNVQKRAAAQGQPLDVVFEHYEKPGEWVRLDTLKPDIQRRVNHRVRSSAAR